MAIKTFNRARALGLLILFALPVAAAGIAYWQQFWMSQTIIMRSIMDSSTIVQVVKQGLMTIDIKIISTDDAGTSTTTETNVKWYETAKASSAGCDTKCRLANICGSIQIAAVAVGLATWTLWLLMMLFNKLKHGLLATTGIWVMGML